MDWWFLGQIQYVSSVSYSSLSFCKAASYKSHPHFFFLLLLKNVKVCHFFFLVFPPFTHLICMLLGHFRQCYHQPLKLSKYSSKKEIGEASKKLNSDSPEFQAALLRIGETPCTYG